MTTEHLSLSLTGKDHARLRAHLFPGDGLEAVAVALCGRRTADDRLRILVHELFLNEAFAAHDLVEAADGFIDRVRARFRDHSVG
jgi:hypothetical protein